MTVQNLIDLLQDLPKDAEVGKKVTHYMGIRGDETEQVFTPFVSLNYVVEVKKDKTVKNVILEQIIKNNIKTGIWYVVDDIDHSISKIDILHVDSKTITEYCGYGEWETSRITKFDYKVYIPTGNRWSQTIRNAYLSGKLCKTLEEAKEYAISMCEDRKTELNEKLIKFDIEIEKIKSLEL